MKSGEVSRRFVVGALGAGTVAAATSAIPKNALARSQPGREPGDEAARSASSSSSDVTGQLVAPLVAGATLASWSVVRLVPFVEGAASVVLTDQSGAAFQLDVCARDRGRDVPARTEHFDIHLVNEGDGATATLEDHGLAAMALAEIVRSNEHAVDRTVFTTLSERLSRGTARRHLTP